MSTNESTGLGVSVELEEEFYSYECLSERARVALQEAWFPFSAIELLEMIRLWGERVALDKMYQVQVDLANLDVHMLIPETSRYGVLNSLARRCSHR